MTFILDDPAGNSFIENPFAPQSDPYIKLTYYERTREMAETMGYMIQPQDNETHTEEITAKSKEYVYPEYYSKNKNFSVYKSTSEISAHLLDFTKSIEQNNDFKGEALKFETDCYCCYQPGETHMCMCTIPFFKEIIIMCFKCQKCGYKSTEVKGGGGISEKAMKYTLKVNGKDDLNRDVFKSETCKISIPDIGFETDTSSMGSMYTTVEGLLEKLIETLDDIPFGKGDSTTEENNEIRIFMRKLRELKDNQKGFTLILDDPLSNSFINTIENPEKDFSLEKEIYERTWDQNEDLGINDMKVENYAEHHNVKQEDEEEK
jgi:zinc finger protein